MTTEPFYEQSFSFSGKKQKTLHSIIVSSIAIIKMLVLSEEGGVL